MTTTGHDICEKAVIGRMYQDTVKREVCTVKGKTGVYVLRTGHVENESSGDQNDAHVSGGNIFNLNRLLLLDQLYT